MYVTTREENSGMTRMIHPKDNIKSAPKYNNAGLPKRNTVSARDHHLSQKRYVCMPVFFSDGNDIDN